MLRSHFGSSSCNFLLEPEPNWLPWGAGAVSLVSGILKPSSPASPPVCNGPCEFDIISFAKPFIV
jgi:hypothetical protein